MKHNLLLFLCLTCLQLCIKSISTKKNLPDKSQMQSGFFDYLIQTGKNNISVTFQSPFKDQQQYSLAFGLIGMDYGRGIISFQAFLANKSQTGFQYTFNCPSKTQDEKFFSKTNYIAISNALHWNLQNSIQTNFSQTQISPKIFRKQIEIKFSNKIKLQTFIQSFQTKQSYKITQGNQYFNFSKFEQITNGAIQLIINSSYTTNAVFSFIIIEQNQCYSKGINFLFGITPIGFGKSSNSKFNISLNHIVISGIHQGDLFLPISQARRFELRIFPDGSRYDYNHYNMSSRINYFLISKKCDYKSEYFDPANNICLCKQRYYALQNDSCAQCLPTCLTCFNNETCLSCNQTLNRIYNSQICLCRIGYFQNSKQLCESCQSGCIECVSKLNCTKCQFGYNLADSNCQRIRSSTTFLVRFEKSTISNQVFLILSFSNPVIIKYQLMKILNLKIFNQSIDYSIQNKTQDSQFRITFITPHAQPRIVCIFQENSINTIDGGLLVSYEQTYELKFLEYYSEKDILVTEFISDKTAAAASLISASKSYASCMCITYLFLSIIQYGNIAAIYNFLDTPLPRNLRQIFENFYSLLQINLLPFQISTPAFGSQQIFQPPSIYQINDYNINFLDTNFLAVAQIIILLLLYTFLYTLGRYNSQHYFFVFLRKKYVRSFYSSCMLLIISCQIPLNFAAASTLLDRKFNTYYKIVNFSIGVTVILLINIIIFMHSCWLFHTKKYLEKDTDECYYDSQRSLPNSEFYITFRLLTTTVISLSIPLLPALGSIVLILLASSLQLAATIIVKNEKKRNKILRSIFCTSQLLFQVLLVVIYFCYWRIQIQNVLILGYIGITLICTNLLVQIVAFLIEFFIIIKIFIQSYSNYALKQKHPEINNIAINKKRKQNKYGNKTKPAQFFKQKVNAVVINEGECIQFIHPAKSRRNALRIGKHSKNLQQYKKDTIFCTQQTKTVKSNNYYGGKTVLKINTEQNRKERIRLQLEKMKKQKYNGLVLK